MTNNQHGLLSQKWFRIAAIVAAVIVLLGVATLMLYRYVNDIYEPSSSARLTVANRLVTTHYPSDMQDVTVSYGFTLQPANIAVNEMMRRSGDPQSWGVSYHHFRMECSQHVDNQTCTIHKSVNGHDYVVIDSTNSSLNTHDILVDFQLANRDISLSVSPPSSTTYSANYDWGKLIDSFSGKSIPANTPAKSIKSGA